MKKDILVLLISVLLSISITGVTAFADDEPIGGKCGTNLTWTLNGGELTISGTGAMDNYDLEGANAPWKDSFADIKTFNIEEGVTTIGDNAFSGGSASGTLLLPQTMQTIGKNAFKSCGFSDIVIAESAEVGAWAFQNSGKATVHTFKDSPAYDYFSTSTQFSGGFTGTIKLLYDEPEPAYLSFATDSINVIQHNPVEISGLLAISDNIEEDLIQLQSSNTNIVSVLNDNKELYPKVTSGQATITASYNKDGIELSTTLTVRIVSDENTGEATGLKIKDDDGEVTSSIINKSKTRRLRYEIETEEGKDAVYSEAVVWSTSDSNVLKVINGEIEAVNAGTATITASLGDDIVETCDFTVENKARKIITFEIGDYYTMNKGETKNLHCYVYPSDATDKNELTYSTTYDELLDVSPNGVVTALGAEPDTSKLPVVKASLGNLKEEMQITVIAHLKDINICRKDSGGSWVETEQITGLYSGEKIELKVAFDPADTTDNRGIIWTSSDENTAVVEPKEEDSAIAEVDVKGDGYTVITAKTQEGNIQTTCRIYTQSYIPLEDPFVTLNKTNVELEYGQKDNLVLTYNPEWATPQEPVWSTDDSEDAIEVVPSGNKKTAEIKALKVTDNTITVTAKVVDRDPFNTTPGYTGTEHPVTCSVTIKAKSINSSDISIGTIDDCEYTGSAITPEPEVKDGDTTLKKDTDYTLTYENNTKAGKADAESGAPAVVITGKGNYTGTRKATFTIKERAIGDTITIEPIGNQTYTGSEITPEPVVKDGDNTLNKNEDYTVKYDNNKNAAKADAGEKAPNVTVTGIGNYSGTKTAKFTIQPKEITTEMIQSISAVDYDGTAKTPAVAVKYNSIDLVQGNDTDKKDYTVKYDNNKNAAGADAGDKAPIVTVTGNGNYTGSAVKTFTINPRNISGMLQALTEDSYTYDADGVKPEVTVKDGETTLICGTAEKPGDYTVSYTNNDAVGSKGDPAKPPTATVTGTGNYTGTDSCKFSITPKTVTTEMIADIQDQEYRDGEEIKPALTVKDGGKTLTCGTTENPGDYTVEYTNNTDVAGDDATNKPTATITGQGNYTGTASKTFKITGKMIKDEMVSAIQPKVYNGSAITPEPEVKDGTKTLEKGTDYTLKYNNNLNAATKDDGDSAPTVTITGTGNYGGSVTVKFTINPKDLSGDSSSITIEEIAAQTYTGSAIEPELVVTDNAIGEGGKKLKQKKEGESGGDYTVTYSHNKDARESTATDAPSATITGTGNYTGTIANPITFTILPKEITDKMVSEIKPQTYTGEILTPSAEVKYGEITLEQGSEDGDKKDCTVTYSHNKDARESTATDAPSAKIKGYGNYSGEVNKTFTINPRPLTDKDIVLSFKNQGASTCIYNGGAYTPEVTVKYSETTLKQTTETETGDYTVSHENNKDAGSADAGDKAPAAVITAEPNRNFSGTVKLKFTINPKSISGVTIADIDAQPYTGSAIKPEISVTDNELAAGDKTLAADEDYTVSYSNNTDAADKSAAKAPTVTIKGKGNYDGTTTAKKTFTITNADISDSVIGSVADQLYTGQAITPKPAVTYKGKALKEGVDFAYDYENNTEAGTATIKAVGQGNYTGTATGTFTIADTIDITRAAVSLSGTSFRYSGKAIAPSATLKYNGQTYPCSVSYANNVKIGKAVAYVTSAKFNGKATLYYTINPQPTKLKKAAKGSRRFTATWSKLSKKKKSLVTGYQICYSKNSKFTSGVKYKNVKGWSKTKVTIKGLSKKTKYYVKIRTYKKSGGTYYSDWSNVKSVKTK